jgi:hypothetical protein
MVSRGEDRGQSQVTYPGGIREIVRQPRCETENRVPSLFSMFALRETPMNFHFRPVRQVSQCLTFPL